MICRCYKHFSVPDIIKAQKTNFRSKFKKHKIFLEKKMIRILALFCFSIVSFHATAESTLPPGCQALAVQGEAITLHAKKSSLIFIHNLAPTDLWITHPIKNPSASAGWTTQLQEGNWTALVLRKGAFTLNCIESRPGHEQQIPCEGAIAVCQWKTKGLKIPNKEQSFWASENRSLDALIADLGTHGFKIPFSERTK